MAGAMGVVVTVDWYDSVAANISKVAPVAAHNLASAKAAGVAAQAIRSGYTGQLARDVSVPFRVAPLVAWVGSDLPYAMMEQFGGTIFGKPRLFIHGRGLTASQAKAAAAGARFPKGGTKRTTTGGPITAIKSSVVHKGKHYLDKAVDAYPPLFMNALRSRLGA